MNAKEVFKSLFYALASISVALICYIANDGLTELKGIKTEMKDLNGKMIEVVTNQKWSDKILELHSMNLIQLDDRLKKLENKR